MYREEILDLYRKPVNVGVIEDVKPASGENASCGDSTEIYVKTVDGEIKDVKHQSDACAIATASICILSSKIQGMSVEELRDLDKEWMLDQLGVEISPMRLKCALLGLNTVQDAIE
ncbi:iron-sulfur cluster assembly scaffold protein [Candidatus Nanohalococcus occultus]|uniref:NifU-like protein involved in Fe-S cluster formation n=1 Tax=Candidatus Nanohalococcus occultus TaxID=2978047 RepID=A0ABY8CDW4_9ARCH|nr:NifU-like protein involved in Fe-S cluster formation [Candidatus Nanohaloarchaeota archaeon SVXNc]